MKVVGLELFTYLYFYEIILYVYDEVGFKNSELINWNG